MTDLNLGYAFAPPDTVLVTVDDTHPVENTLTLVIINRSGAAVEFQNPEGLTPGPHLPAWDDTASPLGRVPVWFPWGDASGDLARVGDAARIVCSSLSSDWAASDRMSDPTLGVYWTLFPLSKSVFLGQDESISFQFTGIVSHAGTDAQLPAQTWMTALPRVTGYTAQQAQAPVWKTQLSATLTAPASAVPGSEITLAWETVGVDSCELDPGDYRGLAASGHQPVTMPSQQSVTWTLTAYPHGGGSPIYSRATVTAQTGWTDLGPVPSTLPNDNPLLTWMGDRFLVIGAMSDCWTSPDGKSWSKVGQLPSDVFDWNGSLVVNGGRVWLFAFNFDTGARQVYSSTDGASWTLADPGVPWPQPNGFTAAAAFKSLWGFADTTVWSSQDGKSWSQHPAPPWSGGRFPPSAVGFAGKLWAFTDTLGRPEAHFWSTADGASWSGGQAAPWDASRWMVAAVATRLHAYVATKPEVGSPNTAWQMDGGGNWAPVDLPPDLANAKPWALTFTATDWLLVGYNGAGHLWTYAPPLTGESEDA